MGGKLWSDDEERYFWREVVSQSSRRAGVDRARPEKSWTELAKMMTAAMGAGARRKYNGQSMFEHFFQNFEGRRLSPNAETYLAEYRRKSNPGNERQQAMARVLAEVAAADDGEDSSGASGGGKKKRRPAGRTPFQAPSSTVAADATAALLAIPARSPDERIDLRTGFNAGGAAATSAVTAADDDYDDDDDEDERQYRDPKTNATFVAANVGSGRGRGKRSVPTSSARKEPIATTAPSTWVAANVLSASGHDTSTLSARNELIATTTAPGSVAAHVDLAPAKVRSAGGHGDHSVPTPSARIEPNATMAPPASFAPNVDLTPAADVDLAPAGGRYVAGYGVQEFPTSSARDEPMAGVHLLLAAAAVQAARDHGHHDSPTSSAGDEPTATQDPSTTVAPNTDPAPAAARTAGNNDYYGFPTMSAREETKAVNAIAAKGASTWVEPPVAPSTKPGRPKSRFPPSGPTLEIFEDNYRGQWGPSTGKKDKPVKGPSGPPTGSKRKTAQTTDDGDKDYVEDKAAPRARARARGCTALPSLRPAARPPAVEDNVEDELEDGEIRE